MPRGLATRRGTARRLSLVRTRVEDLGERLLRGTAPLRAALGARWTSRSPRLEGLSHLLVAVESLDSRVWPPLHLASTFAATVVSQRHAHPPRHLTHERNPPPRRLLCLARSASHSSSPLPPLAKSLALTPVPHRAARTAAKHLGIHLEPSLLGSHLPLPVRPPPPLPRSHQATHWHPLSLPRAGHPPSPLVLPRPHTLHPRLGPSPKGRLVRQRNGHPVRRVAPFPPSLPRGGPQLTRGRAPPPARATHAQEHRLDRLGRRVRQPAAPRTGPLWPRRGRTGRATGSILSCLSAPRTQ